MAESSDSELTNRGPEEIIARAGGVSICVGEMLARAAALAGDLPERAYVLNLCRNRYHFLLGFCASVMAGQCTLMPPNRQPNTIRTIASSYDRSYVLGDVLHGFECVRIDSIRTDKRIESAPRIPDQQLSAILFTSGSTGTPTEHPKSWRTLRLGALNDAGMLFGDAPAHMEMLATIPPQHMWGFEASILLPLVAPIAISDRSPLLPADMRSASAQLRRPRVLVSSPVHLDAFADGCGEPIDIDYILAATAPMSQALAQRLETRFGATVIEIFGSSETGMLASRRPAHDDIWHISERFRLTVRRAGAVIEADHLDAETCLSDRIELLDDRRFRWLGRGQDMVNIAGKRGSVAELNRLLAAVPGVDDSVVFLPSPAAKRLAALVVAPGLEPSAILNALRDSVDPVFLPRPVGIVPSLPRQETGKLSRRAVLDLFMQLRSSNRTGEE
jgi:acyl-coenzyme A synthetase/AMP-(fatty) acid ligase